MGPPGGPLVENLPVNAADAGPMGSIPGPGRSHRPLGNQALVMQLTPVRLEPTLCNRRSHGDEEPQHSREGQPAPRLVNARLQRRANAPYAATGERPAPPRRPSTAKNKLINTRLAQFAPSSVRQKLDSRLMLSRPQGSFSPGLPFEVPSSQGELYVSIFRPVPGACC